MLIKKVYVCTFRFGPLVRHWTMRYEAKHSYFKTLAHTLGNFTNISQHVCYLQNRQMGNDIITGQGNTFVYYIKLGRIYNNLYHDSIQLVLLCI